MNDAERDALTALRKDLTTINRTMADVSAYMGRVFWSKFTENMVPPQKSAAPLVANGDFLPEKAEAYDPAALYYRSPCRTPNKGVKEKARANGFVTVAELTSEISFSSTCIYNFICAQPEASKAGYRGIAIFINKRMLLDRLAKTPEWKRREELGRLFFGAKQ